VNALAPHILSSRPSRTATPPLIPAEGVELATGRAHEICGPARRYLALLAAAACQGPVFWIAPSWCRVTPHPPGFSRWLDPGRITFVTPTRTEDVLWSLEETLRAGIVPLVVADLPTPPDLTPVRRLHLAAETGGAETGLPPVALLMTPEGAAPGIETRWSVTPACEAARPAWKIDRLRDRTKPPASWTVDATGRALPPA